MTPRRTLHPGRFFAQVLFGLGAFVALAEPALAAPVPVAVSVPPQAWLVRRIGGDRVAVTVVIPPGGSHDAYEPSPRQIVAIGRARLWVAVGHPAFGLETHQIAPLLAGREATVVKMFDEAAASGAGAAGLAQDLHVWLSPVAMSATARQVAESLSRLDPEGAAGYRERLAGVLAEIEAVDARARRHLEGCAGRAFLVYHPAWGWFAERYGLRQLAIEEEGKEPGFATLREVIGTARREGIRSVFVQSGYSEAPAHAVARELGGEVEQLDPLTEDWPAGMVATAVALCRAMGC